jgi:hypothetical protein
VRQKECRIARPAAAELTPALRAKIPPRPSGRHQTAARIGARANGAVIVAGEELIRRVGKETDLKPYLLERYLPRNAAVFCIDEESAVQTLDRGRTERHGCEYYTGGFPCSRR